MSPWTSPQAAVTKPKCSLGCHVCVCRVRWVYLVYQAHLESQVAKETKGSAAHLDNVDSLVHL